MFATAAADVMAAVGIGLALVLISSGTAKLVMRRQFASIVSSWRLGPDAAAKGFAVTLPVGEIVAGGLLVPAALGADHLAPAAWLAVATFTALAVGQRIVRHRAKAASCGCFGRATAISAKTIARADALACAAIVFAVLESTQS